MWAYFQLHLRPCALGIFYKQTRNYTRSCNTGSGLIQLCYMCSRFLSPTYKIKPVHNRRIECGFRIFIGLKNVVLRLLSRSWTFLYILHSSHLACTRVMSNAAATFLYKTSKTPTKKTIEWKKLLMTNIFSSSFQIYEERFDMNLPEQIDSKILLSVAETFFFNLCALIMLHKLRTQFQIEGWGFMQDVTILIKAFQLRWPKTKNLVYIKFCKLIINNFILSIVRMGQ